MDSSGELVNVVSGENESAATVDADNDIATHLVQTNSGAVCGKMLKTLRHKTTYYSFKGIPYAKAPTGKLRFKAPEKVDNWSPRVHDATEYGNSSVQFHTSRFMTLIGPQSEDCLFLNIYTPDVTPAEKLPVIFYIHGGGFIEGSGNEYHPDFLIEKDVIVVTINYRVGVFGFLALGLPEYSGNMGLKDQQLALEWIHENIHHFGGDNKRITVSGTSAGGVSAHYHTLSVKSRQYFANAIVMSGTALVRYALSEKDKDEDISKMFAIAHKLGHSASNSNELVAFLQQIPAEELIQHTSYSKGIGDCADRGEPLVTYFGWIPTIESKDAVRPFLTAEPKDIMKNSEIDVTTLFGVTSEEFLYFATRLLKDPAALKHFNENFRVQLPFRGCKLDFDSEEYRQLAAEIRQHYFGTNTIIDKDSISTMIDMLSDLFVFYLVDQAAKLQANAGKTYYFTFSVDSEFNLFKALRNVELPGSAHEDDRAYVFRCESLDEKYQAIFDQPDRADNVAYKTLERMTQLWSNFARYGTPTVENELEFVKPISGKDVHYFDVRNEGFVTSLAPNKKAVEFLSQLEEKYQKIMVKLSGVQRDEL